MGHWVRLSRGRRRGGLHRVREVECRPFHDAMVAIVSTAFRLPLLSALLASVALTSWSDASVSDVVVSQRWPWNEKVDIDFTLAGDTADVGVYASWDALRGDAVSGVPSSVHIGTLFSAKPGHNRFTWDPSLTPQADKTLTGFAVSLVPTAVGGREYLVLDLQGGGYSYLSNVPEGGWTDEHKSTKMVFRRVPAGSYTLGMSSAELARWYGTDTTATTYKNEKVRRGLRTQVFSSDYYLAIFQMTEAQHAAVVGGVSSQSRLPKLITYDELRGTTNATDGICWPASGHDVATDSFLGRLRRRVNAGFTIDLPTEEQWEAAVRAGTSTVFPNGGSVDDDDETLWSTYAQSSWYHGNGGTELKEVGLKVADNSLGFHDMLANRVEWTLDVWRVDNYGRASRPGSGTDPVGAATWNDASQSTVAGNIEKINKEYGKRVVRSAFPKQDSATLTDVLPSVRNGRYPQATDATARLCIHLKPLVSP